MYLDTLSIVEFFLKNPCVCENMFEVLRSFKMYRLKINYERNMNVEKTKAMRISKQPSPVTIMLDKNNWRMWNVLNIWVAC